MPRSRRNAVLAVIAVAAVVVLVGGAVVGLPRLGSYGSPRSPYAGSGERITIRKDSRQPVVVGQPVRLGAGPKVVRLYLDFHCPDCVGFGPEYAATIEQAVGEDRAQLVVYPLALTDDGSAAAANAYACAAAGGQAEDYLAGLLANPGLRWSDRQLVALGDFAGANFTPEFATCVDQRSHRAWVDSIRGVAAADGVSATPAVFVGADRVDVDTLTPERLQALLQG